MPPDQVKRHCSENSTFKNNQNQDYSRKDNGIVQNDSQQANDFVVATS